MRLTLFVLISSVCAVSASAQERGSTAQTLKAAACSDGLQVLGLTSPPRKVELRVRYDSASDSSVVTYDRPDPSLIVRPRIGVNMVGGVMHFAHRPPSDLPHLELELLVHSAAPRAAEERILSVILDDSVHMGLGLAGAHPSVSIGGGVNEYLLSMVEPSDALRLLRARKIRGSLGSTTFEVSDQDRDGLRDLVLYVRCGGH